MPDAGGDRIELSRWLNNKKEEGEVPALKGERDQSVNIILPLVAALPMDPTYQLLYTFFVFIWSFLGYYYSPLHLCQLLTIKYMGCATGAVYREHLKLIPWLFVASYLLFYLYRWILL